MSCTKFQKHFIYSTIYSTSIAFTTYYTLAYHRSFDNYFGCLVIFCNKKKENGNFAPLTPIYFQIMAHNYRDLLVTLTVKNKEGKTFDAIDSLKFKYQVRATTKTERRVALLYTCKEDKR